MKRCCRKSCPNTNPQPESNFHKNKNRPDGLMPRCKDCNHLIAITSARVNARVREGNRRKCGLCRCGNIVALAHAQCQECLDYASEWRRSTKLEVFAAYGDKCVCCGEIRMEFLSIDHINGGGKLDRKKKGRGFYRELKKQGFPKDNFRLLCMNCNFALGHFGYCPHQKELTQKGIEQ